MEILIAACHRILSGLQNGFGYAKKKTLLWIVAIVLILYPLFVAQSHWLFILFFIVNIATVFLKTNSFTDSKILKKYKDIHLWEYFVTGGFFIYMILAGFNVLLLLCSVYPALIIHKGLINIGSGLKFFASATDDSTGKTVGILMLGIKIKRAATSFRVILAIISIIAAIVISATSISFSLNWF